MSGISSTKIRLAGMASGLDTEGIVKDLMAVSRLKVDDVKRQKLLLEWKQDAYKEITNKLNTFQSKYFGTGSSSSLLSSSLNMLTPTYSSPYVSVVGGSNASTGSMYIADILSLASNSKLEGKQASANPSISVNTDALSELSGKTIAVTLDGISKNITFSSGTYETVDDVQAELSTRLNTAFGSGRISISQNGDSLSLSAPNSALRISVPTDGASSTTGILDFVSYSSNKVDLSMGLRQAGFARDIFTSPEDNQISFSINGKSFSFNNQTSMSDIMRDVNGSDAGVTMSYSSLTDSFSIVSKASGVASSVSVQDQHGYLMDALFNSGKYTAGTDAVVRMSTNGSKEESDLITVQRSSNSFTVNGATLTLLGKASGTTAENVDISMGYDANAMVEKIKAFVTDYNDLLSSITTKTAEERYRDYQPLSDDEKAELSDKEVELWTEKAKSGILRNDTYLNSIANELKSSMYTAVKKLGSSDETMGILAQIGITTGSYSEKGQLHLDESKLRTALSSDPQKVIDILTQQSSVSYSLYAPQSQQQSRFSELGVFSRVSDVISKNLNTVGKKGALITLVGSPNSSYKGETEYSRRIANLQSRIETMNDKLTKQEDRYWNQFTAMETALSKLNSQSSWLAGMLGQGQ